MRAGKAKSQYLTLYIRISKCHPPFRWTYSILAVRPHIVRELQFDNKSKNCLRRAFLLLFVSAGGQRQHNIIMLSYADVISTMIAVCGRRSDVIIIWQTGNNRIVIINNNILYYNNNIMPHTTTGNAPICYTPYRT